MLSYRKPIEKVEVVSETEQFVTYIQQYEYSKPQKEKSSKRSQHASFFDTYDEAKSFLITYLKAKVIDAQSNLDREKATLKRVNDLIQKEVIA